MPYVAVNRKGNSGQPQRNSGLPQRLPRFFQDPEGVIFQFKILDSSPWPKSLSCKALVPQKSFVRSLWPKSLSCVALRPKVVRAYRPAHRHISRATIQDVLMLFYDLLPFVGDRLVYYLGSEERLRLGIAGRRLHPAISWARYNEGRLRVLRLHGTATRLHKMRVDQIYKKLKLFRTLTTQNVTTTRVSQTMNMRPSARQCAPRKDYGKHT